MKLELKDVITAATILVTGGIAWGSLHVRVSEIETLKPLDKQVAVLSERVDAIYLMVKETREDIKAVRTFQRQKPSSGHPSR